MPKYLQMSLYVSLDKTQNIISLAVSVQHRLVTDGRTDRHTTTANARAGYSVALVKARNVVYITMRVHTRVVVENDSVNVRKSAVKSHSTLCSSIYSLPARR